MVNRDDIEAASARLRGHARRTPNITVVIGGIRTVLKLEFLQHTGTFKARGALSRLLSGTVPPAGVVAASGGNHGAAVAYAARELGVQATIFVPELTPAAKLGRIAGYGASVVREGATFAEALDASRVFQRSSGAMEVHAYDDPLVVAGQGTVGLELAGDAPEVSHVLVAVGGGGLIGGISGWYGKRGAEVIGVEPELCPAWHAARDAGGPVPVAVGGVAVDSLGARQVGQVMFAVASAHGVQSVLVTEAAITEAQRWLWTELRIVSEPGGAVALAALLSGAWQPPAGATPAVILCGANTDLAAVSRAG